MALDLGGSRDIKIQVEVTGTAQAAAELKTVDRAIEGVGKSTAASTTSAKTYREEMDRLFPAIRRSRDELEGMKTTASNVEKGFTALQTATLGFAGVAAAAIAGLSLESARYYMQQTGMINQNIREINNLRLAWSNFRMGVGEALIGAERDMGQHINRLADFVNRAGTLMSGLIRASQTPQAAFAGPIGAALVAAQAGGSNILDILRNGGDIGTLPDIRRTTNIGLGPGAPGLPKDLDAIDRQWVQFTQRMQEQWASDAKRAAEARAREMERLASQWGRLLYDERGVPSLPGTSVLDMMYPPAFALPATSPLYRDTYGMPSSLPGAVNDVFPPAGEFLDWNSMLNRTPTGGGFLSGFTSLFSGGGLRNLRGVSGFLNNLGFLPSASLAGRSISGALAGGALGASASAGLSSFVGASVLPALGPIGAVAGLALPFIKNLFGYAPGAIAQQQADAQIRQIQSGLLDQFGSVSNIAGMGNAGANLAAAWGDRNVAGLEHFKQLTEDFTKSLDDLNQKTAQQAALQAQITALREQQITTWDEANAVIQKYGLDIAGLGKGVQQGQTTATASTLLNDMQTLFDYGADVGGVIYQLRGQISGLVNDARKFGTELPDNLRPFIEDLARSGNLLDENGQLLTDLSGLQWGEAVKTQAEIIADSIAELTKTLNELTESIKSGFPNAVKQGVDEAQRVIDGTVWRVPNVEMQADVLSVSTGGYVGPHGLSYFGRGGWVPRGTDTVPAMLSPGEYVLRRDAVDRIGVPALAAMNRGAGVTVNIGGVSVDASNGVWDSEASRQRFGDYVASSLMSRLNTNVQWSR